MSKMAIFVEGQTEQLFVERLLLEIATVNQIQIQHLSILGKGRVIALKTPPAITEHFVLILNSGTDNRVASDVRDNYANLVRAGYSHILAVRDVYPLSHSDIPKLVAGLGFGIKTHPLKPVFILAVLELEAWFLAEHLHYQKLHSDLTAERVAGVLGADPSVDDMALRPHPSKDLDDIYATVGLKYDKRKATTLRTVSALDYEHIYVALVGRLPPIARLVAEIDSFLVPRSATP